jgi:molecular chaperone GrpE (heat shock protein)
MRLSPNGPPDSVELKQPRIVTSGERGNRQARKKGPDVENLEREIHRLKRRIADMAQGFENIRARRCSELERSRRLLVHGVKFNKLNHQLFRLRQAALPFASRENHGTG